MTVETQKTYQSRLKSQYLDNPESAIQTLSASGLVDFGALAVNLEAPGLFSPAGLHESSGGDGTAGCPVEIMLASWAACAGVTLASVAHSMKLEIQHCRVTASGTMDFRGTLAVNKSSPVGLMDLRLEFELETNAPNESVDKLIQLTERFCVVHQTLANPPTLKTIRK